MMNQRKRQKLADKLCIAGVILVIYGVAMIASNRQSSLWPDGANNISWGLIAAFIIGGILLDWLAYRLAVGKKPRPPARMYY